MTRLRWVFGGRWVMITMPLALALPIFFLTLFTKYLSIAPWGSELGFTLMMLVLGGLMLAGLGLGLCGLIATFVPKARRHAPVLLFSAVACFASMKGGVLVGAQLRWKKCVQLEMTARPIVAALHAFEQKYGRSPASLHSLVPEFLPALPRTGVGACPNFDYTNGTLSVYLPSNLLEFDTFRYVPAGVSGYASEEVPFERMGDWIYLYAQ